jgi:hypothetical protein
VDQWIDEAIHGHGRSSSRVSTPGTIPLCVHKYITMLTSDQAALITIACVYELRRRTEQNEQHTN